MNVILRPEIKSDFQGITKVNNLAFGQPNEGILVKKLRENPSFVSDLSIVASGPEDEVFGHILFFPVNIVSEKSTILSLALAPMSVLPAYQNKGIGTNLVLKGLSKAKELGYSSVIVLGHPEFYPRFGFKPASKWNINSPYNVPDEVFMALELIHGSLSDVSGTVQYPKEFEEVE